MNRRSFLKLLGLAPFAPKLLEKLTEPEILGSTQTSIWLVKWGNVQANANDWKEQWKKIVDYTNANPPKFYMNRQSYNWLKQELKR